MHHANLAYIDMSKRLQCQDLWIFSFGQEKKDHPQINNLNIIYQTRSHHLLDLFSTNRDGIQ